MCLHLTEFVFECLYHTECVVFLHWEGVCKHLHNEVECAYTCLTMNPCVQIVCACFVPDSEAMCLGIFS